MLLADMIIFSMSNLLLVAMVFILQLETFMNNAGWMFLVLEWFGPAFICLSYAVGYVFKNPETGYKYSIILGALIYAIPYVLTLSFMPEPFRSFFTTFFEVIIPFLSLNNSLLEVIKQD